MDKCKWCGYPIKKDACDHITCQRAYARGFDSPSCEQASEKLKEMQMEWAQRLSA